MYQQVVYAMGRATSDGEVLESKSGREYGKFGLAVNEYRGPDQEENVTFYDVVSFNRQSKAATKRVTKGDPVMVTGKPSASAYISKKTGEPTVNMSCTAKYIHLFPVPRFDSKKVEDTDSEENE